MSRLSTLSFVFCLYFVNSFDLSEYGIQNDYYASGITIYRNRAFLTIPRSICNKNYSKPTLVEMPWSEDVFLMPNILDPFKIRKKIGEIQEWGNCEHIQDAISLDIEPRKPNLWILDKGNKDCPAKVVGYSLFINSITQTSELTGIPQKHLNKIVIDPHLDFGLKAYIGEIGDNHLLVVSLQELKWWRLQLIEKSEPHMSISTFFLAISKNLPTLFMTGWNSTEVYEMSLEEVRKSVGPSLIDAKNTIVETNVTFLGNKLGISRGLDTDYKSGLNYYLVRDYAVARWQIDKPLKAEHHSILAQSYQKLPYVSQLFTGPQLGLWALVNPVNPDVCDNINMIYHYPEDKPNVTHRFVKLLKYNRFFL